jgi:hypothetical protein
MGEQARLMPRASAMERMNSPLENRKIRLRGFRIAKSRRHPNAPRITSFPAFPSAPPALMLICNRCGTSIPDGARFCPACGDPVTAGDKPGKHVAPARESVRLVCPHCEHQALFTIASDGVDRLVCSQCAQAFDTSVVRIRAKRSAGQKKLGTRSFSVRFEDLEGREGFIEFVAPTIEDFELRSKDLAAFSSIQGVLTVVQNLSVGRYLRLPRPRSPAPGCAGSAVLWMSVAAAGGALLF